MARTRLLAAAAAALLVAPAAADAAGIRAPLRVETTRGTLLGEHNERVGAARTYLDTAGTPRVLPPNTALGQLAAATAAGGLDLGISFNDQFGGYVASIGGRAPGANGFWAFYVDNVQAPTGAQETFLKRRSEYVWVLDPDFNTPGPFFLDLDVVARGKRSVTFRVTRAGGQRPVAAAGATLHVNGKRVRVPRSGQVKIGARGPWTARATMPGTIASETLTGTS